MKECESMFAGPLTEVTLDSRSLIIVLITEIRPTD